MSCDHKLIAAHVIDYIEGSLPSYLRSQCDEALQHCQHCQQTVQKAHEIYQLANGWVDQDVPAWAHTQHAVRPPIKHQLSWPNMAALAFSFMAVCLVVFQFEVSVDDGLLISFGGSQSDAHIQELLAQQLEEFQSQQNLALETRLDDYTEFQDLNNQLVLSEWLDRNREERQNDLNFLMSSWEAQRFQDRQRVNQQLDILASNQIDSNEYLNELGQTVGFPIGGSL
jgi:hypothetical protein